MIIPSIDLMGGKAVQLRQGKELVLTEERDPIELAREFNLYGEIAVIDLDAAMGKGDNLPLIREICRVADVRAGGGIRTKERGQELLRAGAKRIIIGTSATPEFLQNFPAARVMVAIDHKNGEVVDQGWTQGTGETFLDRAKRLAPYCGGFLCTFVATEGTLQGMDLDVLKQLQSQIDLPLTVAGGVASTEEAAAISRLGMDVQVGMGLYTGKIDLAESIIQSLDFEKCPQIPTVVQDPAGQILMLAYSTPESLKLALQEGRGIYFSRSRNEIWRKGETSAHVQTLLSCRTDCDRDALLFTVEQQGGAACHTNAYSCFGSGLRTPDFSLSTLFDILEQRKINAPEGSYTAKLFADRELLLRKISEEAFEVSRAADSRNLVWEIADTIFFLSVLASAEGIRWQDIEAELGGRHS
jgi:phosphoribosyl-AMP cyclohydrolase / phosphoribosyl-ATP pyrophosphohydrolase